MKTRLLIIIGTLVLLPTFTSSVFAQYLGNSNEHVGNDTMPSQFPSEPLSVETLDEIKKIIILDDSFQKIVGEKPFSFIDGNGYECSTNIGKCDPIIALNVNNETSVSILFSLQEKKILKMDSYPTQYSTPQEIHLNPNEIANQDTESQSIEEKLQIAKKSVMQESNTPGSSSPLLDRTSIFVTPAIVGMIIGGGSFLGLMFYWRKRK